jgi:drug/metabolite transporter (DMT)-like permease
MAIALGPLLLVLVASLASAGFDLTRKLLGRELPPLPMVLLLAAGSVPLFGLALWVQGAVPPGAGYLAPALGSVALNLVANVAFLQSVRLAPLSATVPLLSLTPAFTSLLGVPLLGELPRPIAWAGVALVAGGAYVLGRGGAPAPRAGPGPVPPAAATAAAEAVPAIPDAAVVPPPVANAAPAMPAAPAEAVQLVRGAWLMAGAALLWSLTIPLDKLAVRRASAPLHGLVLTAGIGLGAAAVLIGQRRLGELGGLRRAWPMFVLALVTSTLTLGFQLLALRVVMVSVVETLKRAIGNVAALVLGRIVFGERVGWRQTGAALAMAAGVALIVL